MNYLNSCFKNKAVKGSFNYSMKGVWGSSPRNFCENKPHLGVILSYSRQYFFNFAFLLCMDKHFFDLKKIDNASDLGSW